MAVIREYLGVVDEKCSSSKIKKIPPALCSTNGKSSLHIVLQATWIDHEDEVLASSLTYMLSFQLILTRGAKPVACVPSLNIYHIL